MNFFRKPYTFRRYSEPQIIRGYHSIPYEDLTLPADVQTMENVVITTPDGSESVQRLKVFCDDEILVENTVRKQKADRLWFQGKWFECRSSRLSENTPLRHYTATFVECLDQESGPEESNGKHDGNVDKTDNIVGETGENVNKTGESVVESGESV